MRYDKDRNYFYMGPGVNFNTFNHNGLDFVIDRYNKTRQGGTGQFILSQDMGKIHTLTGFNGGFGWVNNQYGDGIFFMFNYMNGSGKSHAEGEDTFGIFGERDLKLSLAHWTMGIGWMPWQTPMFDVGIGYQFNIDMLQVDTRVNDGPWENLTGDLGELGFGSTLFLQFNFFLFKGFPLSLGVTPYYMFDFMMSDMEDVNEAINPNTYSYDNEDDQMGRMSHLGVQVNANLCIFARKQEGSQKHTKDKTKNQRQTKGFE
jgi:hypothetical protein